MDTTTGKAVSVIDLDTVKPGLIHYDIGDCLRSSCNAVGEETQDWGSVRFDGAVLSDAAFVLRAFGGDNQERLLVFNFGMDLQLNPAPEPLLAPPPNSDWEVLFSTE